MDLEDVIYVNCLLLDKIDMVFGFSKRSGIRRSLITYSCIFNQKKYTDLIWKLSKFEYEIKKQIVCDLY